MDAILKFKAEYLRFHCTLLIIFAIAAEQVID